MNRNIREYTFNVPGFIPGVPGMWSAGQRVAIDEDTKQVLSVWPEPIKEQSEEATPDVPPALEKPAKTK